MARLYKNVAGKWQSHRYWNANGSNVVIVAKEGDSKDYAVYVGAMPGLVLQEQAVSWVLHYGDKIEEELAKFMFPEFDQLELAYRP